MWLGIWLRITPRGRTGLLALASAGVVATFVVAPGGPVVAADSSPCGAHECATSIRAADAGPADGAAGRTAGLRPAVRVRVPVSVASGGPLPTPTNTSPCRRDLLGAAMTIEIPDISYSCPVYGGDQATMDAGAVTHLTDPGSGGLLAEHPGGPGTLWIAAHRSTHGGAFANVPDLVDGALVVVADSTGSASYRIVGRVLVHVRDDMVLDEKGRPTNAATVDAIIRTDDGGDRAPRLLLQTCEGPTMRWMIYGDLVSS